MGIADRAEAARHDAAMQDAAKGPDWRDPVDIIRDFVAEVERRAEDKMLKTGKLEGAHYAAMKQILAEMEAE